MVRPLLFRAGALVDDMKGELPIQALGQARSASDEHYRSSTEKLDDRQGSSSKASQQYESSHKRHRSRTIVACSTLVGNPRSKTGVRHGIIINTSVRQNQHDSLIR